MPARDPLSAESWWGRIDACRKVRTELFQTWRDNVSYRRLRPFASSPPEGTVSVPADWSRTKNKQSQLFFQIPELILRARRPEFGPATGVFASALNFELSEKIHAEHMMNECLGDVINASGVMICMIGYEASFEDVPMDLSGAPKPELGGMLPEGGMGGDVATPPSAHDPQGTLGGSAPGVTPAFPEGNGARPPGPPPTDPSQMMIPRAVYECYSADRISPAHFIWPIEFVGSNWQKAAFLGHEGYLLVADAIRRGWVPEGTEGVQITESEWLLIKDNEGTKPSDSYIKYIQLFTRPFNYDPEEKDPRKIRRVVLVETGTAEDKGRKKVVDEDLAWQRYDPETRKWVGLTDYPIKVGTITHISDLAIPPSDSEAGRSQVKELIKSRSQMVRQRDHSMPLRWFDVNQVDPVIGDRLRKGKWQDMIPMNGPGTNAIGEVARAQYPPENWNFDKVVKGDLDEAWSMGPAQQGIPTPGETTAAEVREMSGANNTRLDYERQWVLRFFLEVAKGVGSLMQMFADDEDYAYVVGDDGVAALHAWNKDKIAGEYIFEARPDSQLRLDVGTRRVEGLNLYKLLRKDPLIDPTALVRRLLEDHGLDPTKMIKPAEKPQPQGPRVSMSIKGEDLLNPMAVAMVNKSATPVTAQDIQAAKALIQTASVTPAELGIGQPTPPVDPNTPPHSQDIPHPGVPEPVQPLNRRFEGTMAGESRDSAMPTVPK